MREASFNSIFAHKLEKEMGGKVIKISDKVTLGLPDSMHLFQGITTFFEVKIGTISSIEVVGDRLYCRPWAMIKDLRQFEMCKSLGKHATVLYVIYWPNVRMTAVLPVETLELYRPSRDSQIDKKGLLLIKSPNFLEGHGVDIYKNIWNERRKKLYDQLGRDGSRISC